MIPSIHIRIPTSRAPTPQTPETPAQPRPQTHTHRLVADAAEPTHHDPRITPIRLRKRLRIAREHDRPAVVLHIHELRAHIGRAVAVHPARNEQGGGFEDDAGRVVGEGREGPDGGLDA